LFKRIYNRNYFIKTERKTLGGEEMYYNGTCVMKDNTKEGEKKSYTDTQHVHVRECTHAKYAKAWAGLAYQ
jgi:hypothetical protein